jgi:hypothetical protein
MPGLNLKPAHKAVTAYYDSLAQFEKLGIKHETAVRSAFQELLEHCARQFDWKLVPEYAIKRKAQADAKADGALLDNYGLNHGLWEAKDSADDLDREIKNKFSIGYPKQNILFWQPDRAVLYQNGERFYQADLTKPDDLVHVLTLFLEFAPPAIAEWEKAVEEFKDKVPQIGASLKALIEQERQTNGKFIAAFEDFCSLCRGSLNPNISVEAVEEMIIQHILTERIFRKIFAYADFIARNVIAQEIEKVITALNSRVFSRDEFSKSLEHFYGAIENAAATITDFHEKQTFLNTVYERFFQGFCVKVPKAIRDELNRRLQNGERARSLVAWLNSHPDVQPVIAAEFGGKPVREQNLSEWRNGGYQQFLQQQEVLEMARQLSADAGELQPPGAPPLTDHIGVWLTARYLLAIRKQAEKNSDGEPDLQALREFCQDFVALQRGNNSAERLKIEQARVEREREKIEEELFAEFFQWGKKPEIRDLLCRDWVSPEEQERRLREKFGLPPEPPEKTTPSASGSNLVKRGKTESDPIQPDSTNSADDDPASEDHENPP